MTNKTLLIKANTMILPRFGGENYISGVGRATSELVHALLQENTEFNIALYATGINSFWIKDLDIPCPKHRFLLTQKIGTQLTKIEPFYVHNFIKKDLIHIPHNYDVVSSKDKLVVTIHDTCLYDLSKERNDKNMMSLWEKTAQQSVGIVTCSENTKNDIIDRFGVSEDKIKVIPWGISHNLFHKTRHSDNLEVIKKFGINMPYFLSVSCTKERKNIRNLLAGFRVFSKINKEVQIVLLWNNPPKHILEENKSLICQKRIIFLNYVSDEELTALYNEALGTLFPSRYEGFGFPILESFACGTPVMTCRNSSLSEIGRDFAIYTNEDDILEMADIMLEMAKGTYKTEYLSNAYMKYSQTFTWRNTAKAYISFYEKYL